MRSFDGGEQKREHSSSVRSGVCVVRGGDIRGTHARAAHSCDRPHRLKRCGVTMVSRIATSVWRAQSRVRAALACEAMRARARVCVGLWHLPCSLYSGDFCSFPLGVPVLTRHPPNLTLLVARRPVLHVCPVSPGVFPVSGLGGQVCVDFLANTSAMRVGQVPLRLCACSQGYHGVFVVEVCCVQTRKRKRRRVAHIMKCLQLSEAVKWGPM